MIREFDLQLEGFETFSEMLNWRNFRSILAKKMRTRNKRLSVLGTKTLSREIRGGNFAPNSPLTAWLKRSSSPLIDNADLIGSIRGKTKAWHTFVVGVKRRTPSGNNLAHMLETGFTIKVTDKMRALFLHWANESGGKFKGLKKSTKAIRVKPRPYMKQAFFDDKTFVNTVVEQWKEAVHKTFVHFVEKGKKEKSK